MIAFVRIQQAAEKFVKLLRFGKSDVQTASQVLNWGIDSKPVKGTLGVHSETQERGESVCFGYVKDFAKTKEGETRIYCTDSSGDEKFEIYLRNDGKVEFNGSDNFLVKYNELKSGFDQLKSDFNGLVTLYNAHIHPVSGASTLVTTSVDTPSTADISDSKNDSLLC